jgi:hypothetical protein
MAAKHVSAKQAAVKILSRAGEPMAVQELITKVLSTPGVKLGGKTPRATVAAQIYTGKEFEKAGRGIVKLATTAEPEAEPKRRLAQRRPKAPTKKRTGSTKP